MMDYFRNQLTWTYVANVNNAFKVKVVIVVLSVNYEITLIVRHYDDDGGGLKSVKTWSSRNSFREMIRKITIQECAVYYCYEDCGWSFFWWWLWFFKVMPHKTEEEQSISICM